MASLKVMKESAKWRSGREAERVVSHRPSGRGGETPHTFGDDERVAAESDRDVMMPAWVRIPVMARSQIGLSRALGHPARRVP